MAITLDSNNGISFPAISTATRTAIATPSQGQTVYDTDIKCLAVYNGTSWVLQQPTATDDPLYWMGV